MGVKADPDSWIADGQKFGLIGMPVKLDHVTVEGPVSPNLSVVADTMITLPAHWRDWLGRLRVEDIESCNLFLLAKKDSSSPEVLDGESEELQRRVWHFFVGLQLASSFAPSERPIMLGGARYGGEIDIHQQTDLDRPVPQTIHPYPKVTAGDIQMAALLGENLEAMGAATIGSRLWRLFRTITVYLQSRSTSELIDRIHQYCRVVDGLILSTAGNGARQFKSRTELFIGTRHHELMGEVYRIRSACEHLHEYDYLDPFNRDIRLDLVKKEAIIAYVARTALERIVSNADLWDHFGNPAGLEAFWAMSAEEQRRVWGPTIDPTVALACFNPDFIHDGILGK